MDNNTESKNGSVRTGQMRAAVLLGFAAPAVAAAAFVAGPVSLAGETAVAGGAAARLPVTGPPTECVAPVARPQLDSTVGFSAVGAVKWPVCAGD